jgi:hypothetical protein
VSFSTGSPWLALALALAFAFAAVAAFLWVGIVALRLPARDPYVIVSLVIIDDESGIADCSDGEWVAKRTCVAPMTPTRP